MPDHEEVTKGPSEDLVFDGERFIPGAGVGIAYEHWARYAFAEALTFGREVLEVGCGEGYGSAFLAARAQSVVAFDASPRAIAHARRTYAGSGVRFEEATVRSFFATCPEESFDVVVAFEIIEHVPMEEQALLLDGIRRVLRPDGMGLISTPDKLLYTDRSLAKNPFHVHEYYRDEFDAELRNRFAHVKIFDQALITGCALVAPGGESARTVQMVWTDLLRAQGSCRPGLRTSGEYLIALVGEGPLPDPPSLVLADFSRKLIAEGLQAERRTADRLSRELEEARRAWEGALMAGAQARDEAQRARAELRKVQETATESARVEEVRRQLEYERDRSKQVLDDLRDLRAQVDLARRALHPLREARQRGLEGRLRGLAQLIRAVPVRSWLNPLVALRTLRVLRGQRRTARLIEGSGLFDREYYLAHHEDVARSRIDPVDHFVRHGAAEGRDPHPLFDTSFYVSANPDVAKSGMNPLLHFVLHGGRERRRPHALFDCAFYLDRNPDVARSGANPLVHYLEYGAAEGRDPSLEFHTRQYLEEHPEAAAGGWNPLVHFARTGAGRQPVASSSPGHDTPALARWRSEIEKQPRRALVVDATLLTPDRDSGSITTLELMKALQSLGYAVTFVPADLKHSDRYADALESGGFWCLTGRIISSVHAFLQAHGDLFDVVMLCRVTVACHLIDQVRARCPNAVLLFETMDLHHLRAEREATLTGSENARQDAQAVKTCELDVVRRSDVTLVHSVFEREVLARQVPGAILSYFPYILDVQGCKTGFDGRRDLVFIGGFRHQPNVDAVTHFVREIFPLVRKELPGVRLLIVGSDPPADVRRLVRDDILVTGYVDRLQPILENCRLTVAPLRYGAGYKGKVAMSLAHGVPGVLSSVAAEGMELSHEKQVLIADDPAAFAAQVLRLYRDQDLWEGLSRAGLEFAAEHFSPEAARGRMERVLLAAGASPWDAERAGSSVPSRPVRSQPGRAVFPSRFMQELHRRAGLEFADAVLVPHGVDFKHPPDAARADRGTLVEPSALSLLFAGRVVQFKGVHTALESLPRIAERLPHLEVRLTIVGDTQDTSYMEQLHRLLDEGRLDDRVRFLPPVREEDLFALFQKHDAYLFPSLFEPFALTLIRALEAGIPVVASATGGNVDIVIDHRTGLLFPAGDARALADAVIELACNHSLRRSLSRAGRAAAERLTIDAMVGHIEKCLREAADGARQEGSGGTRA